MTSKLPIPLKLIFLLVIDNYQIQIQSNPIKDKYIQLRKE